MKKLDKFLVFHRKKLGVSLRRNDDNNDDPDVLLCLDLENANKKPPLADERKIYHSGLRRNSTVVNMTFHPTQCVYF